MAFLILLLALASGTIPHETELKESVSAYWDLLAKGDKAGALKYVLQESQNNFIARREPMLRSWRYLDALPGCENQVRVTIGIEAMFAGGHGFEKFKRRESWVWQNQSWKVRVEKPSVANLAALFTAGARKPLPKTLSVTPALLKLPFLNDPQQGTVTIQNGTLVPAEVVSVKYDQSRFDLVDPTGRVDPGHVFRLRLRYKGNENEKNLKSQLTVVVRQSDKDTVCQIPVVYNYLSPGARGLLGLTEEQAQALKKGDKVSPALQKPAIKNRMSPEKTPDSQP